MEIKYAWQRPYVEAMLELNPSELPGKVDFAKEELHRRSEELMFARDAESMAEWQAVADALNNLTAIQKHELKTTRERETRGVRNSTAQGAL
jgi:hypothetical protein